MPSGTEKTVDLGLFFKEGYCFTPESDDDRKSTEVATDEKGADGNTREEKRDEEGWAGGVFHFSEEGPVFYFIISLLLPSLAKETNVHFIFLLQVSFENNGHWLDLLAVNGVSLCIYIAVFS